MQTKQDEKLEEVRAILQRLQRISTGKEDDDAADTVAESAQVSPAPAAVLREPALERPQRMAPPALATPARIAVMAATALLLLGGVGLVIWPGSEPPPPTKLQSEADPATAAAVAEPPPATAGPEAKLSPPQVLEADATRLSEAHELMEKGKIVEARRLLLGDLAESRADAALLLARSYDPNALQLIADPNASADAVEAERWYRRWYKIAGQDGMILDEDRLDRIIRAMR